jgi:type IV pilus assembly protein PilY1
MTFNRSFDMKKIITAGLFVMLFSFSLQHADAATMNDYCLTPPYIGSSVEPNLLLMIDNSASMYDLAYQDTANMYCANSPTTSCPTAGTTCAGTAYCLASVTTTTTTSYSPKPCTKNSQCTASGSKCTSGFCSKCDTTTGSGDCVSTTTTNVTPVSCTTDATCSAKTPGDTCNNKCGVTRQCYDTTYSNTASYIGYFNATATYNYDFTNNKLTSGVTMPGTCTYGGASSSMPYVCVNTTGSGTSEIINTGSVGFVASGNFLNWLTASKFDIEKQILTGGKYDTSNGVLIAETRGCAGRKFIKAVPGVNLTFAIRGGTPGGIGTTMNQATEYGQTYIDIYTGIYNAADCLAAMNDWINVTSSNPPNLGSFQNDTKGCVGAGNGVLNGVSVWNHILHDCYQGMTGGSQGYSTNLGPLEGECQTIYATPLLPSDMTDPNAPYAVCSSVISYTDPSGNSQTGYLGVCYSGGSFSTPCDVTQMTNYCVVNVNQQPVVDPSSTAISGSGQGAPGFILEQGLMNTVLVGTLTAKIGLTPAPTGLIDKYKSSIRFGAMTFQNNGSGSECTSGGLVPCTKACSVTTTRMCYVSTDCPTGETCGTLPKTDGAIITSYVGAGTCSSSGAACAVTEDCNAGAGESCVASVGDHSTGLIQSIDNIVASSWTPFAESFYNAMGYYARANDYPDYSLTPIPAPASRDFNFSSFPASYNTSKNPSQKTCQKNNVLLVTDGMSTADLNPQVNGTSGLATNYASTVASAVGVSPTVYSAQCQYKGSTSLPVLTWVANNRNIKSLSLTDPTQKHCTNNLYGAACASDADCGTGNLCTNLPTRSSESITSYFVYTGPPTSSQSGLCDPMTLMTAAATNGGTSLFSVSNLAQLNDTLTNAFDQVAAKAASGTAASVLASSEGSGANIIQAVFYPHKQFTNSATGIADEISWIGRLTNLWYYVDPKARFSSLMEDNGTITSTNATPWNGDKILNLLAPSTTTPGDFIVQMYYDKTAGVTKANRWTDPGANGVIGTPMPTINFEDLGYLWEAGTLLWRRDLGASPRTIKTTIGGGLIDFSTANAATLAPYLQAASATDIINWTTGYDIAGYRSRTVKVESIDTTPRVWKLGDVINSTPRIMSWKELNYYYTRYGDATYFFDANPNDTPDNSHFTTTAAYKKRGMVFAGGNDGMLHAFKLGTMQLNFGQSATVAAKLVDPDTGLVCSSSVANPTCGQEKWAFIPKNALPYLQYMADQAYCHVNSIDLTPFIFDASIGGVADTPDTAKTAASWRTVLIGGMRFGGACRDSASTCTNCVKTPAAGLGYSSYFALDVTDPNNPSLLWEFTDPALGFSTTGPSVVRIGDKTKNGHWFVVFGSGPTGPISTVDHQFLGRSDQNLKLFILDLKSGALLRTIDTGISSAFAGSLALGALDLDNYDYQDELVYVPFVTAAADGTWTDGGVGRLMTMRNPDPSTWAWNKLIEGIGPVTSAVAKIYDKNTGNLWVLFGTGRYYYVQNSASDDPNGQRRLFGIKDPCELAIANNTACTAGDPSVQFSTLTDVTDVANVPLTSDIADASPFKGWYISLDPAGLYTYPPDAATNFVAERVITDPLVTTSGLAYFTTYKPFTDLCLLSGNSFIWVVQYNTGGPPLGLQGLALVQTSTGAIQQINLSSALTEGGGRKALVGPGQPPVDQGLSVQVPAQPVRRTIHVKER